jgi:hypothetical protein
MNNLLFSKGSKVLGLAFRVTFLVSLHRFGTPPFGLRPHRQGSTLRIKDKESIKELKIEYLWMSLSEA